MNDTNEIYWRYDEPAPGGAKVLLLTEGGICIIGVYRSDGGFIGWSPLPKRDREKERTARLRSEESHT